MGLPRIVCNARNIDLTKDVAEFEILPMRAKSRNMSASGKCETLNIAAGYTVRATIRNLSNSTDAAVKTALYQAMQWAEAGEAWVFSRDRDITVNTVLDFGAAAGATSLNVTSPTGVVSGSRYALESATQAATVTATNTTVDPVSIAVSLDNGFPAGSRFRAFEYLPMLGVIRITEHTSGMYFDVEISGQVDRRAL